MRTVETERLALQYVPFGDDFGSPGDRTLRDHFVSVRKRHECHMCGGSIIRRERSRVLIGIFDGELCDYRWCWKCCKAMAVSWTDAGRQLEARTRLLFLRHRSTRAIALGAARLSP